MSNARPSDRIRLRRMPKRGHYDQETINRILDAGMLAHVAYTIDGKPYVTPTAYWREGQTLYWHGSSASRMLRMQAPGVPVCVTVTHMDGLVLARAGFHHSINYRSVMAFGDAHIVTDVAEKAKAMDHFVDRFFPGRSAETRPVHAQELKATSLMRMNIDEASAKVRVGGPVDDDEDYVLPIWAGVIAFKTVMSDIEPDERNLSQAIRPAYLDRYKAGARLDEVLSSIYDADH